MRISDTDQQWMARAFELARRGEGAVSPNPMVGCVLVKNGKKISEGFHKKFGGPHAEINALKKLGRSSTKGGTMYVTLEPCVHFGKTPPCVPEIIQTGVSRVVIGMKDTNPKVSGKGIRSLRKAGIQVYVIGKPQVVVKVAMSLDGKTATKNNESKWITSKASRDFSRGLRDQYDSILVGKNTVLCDDPKLSGKKSEPTRIVLDSKLETPLSANAYRNTNVIVVTTSKAPKKKLAGFQKKGITVKIFPKKIQLSMLTDWLYREKLIRSLFVEGGSEVSGSFFDAKLVDDVYFFIAPLIIGGRNAVRAISGDGISQLVDACKISEVTIKNIGSDILVHGKTPRKS